MAGKMKSANWISGTGFRPWRAIPTAVPMMPPSARGVSMTRSWPNSSCSPCVARKTPPKRPTSSPITTTLGSRRISRRRASFTAWMTLRVGTVSPLAIAADARVLGQGGAQLLELLALLPQRPGVDVVEEGLKRRLLLEGLGLGQGLLDLLPGLGLEARVLPVGKGPAGLQVQPHPPDGVLPLPGLEQLRRPVGLGVVGGGVPLHAVGDALEERRPLAGGGSGPGPPGGGVNRQEVVPVHPLAVDAVGQRLLGDGLGGGLPLPRHADGPSVVAAHQDDRGLAHPGEVQPGVEVVGAGGPLPEPGEDHHVLLLDAGGPGRPHRLRDLGGDGRADGEVAPRAPGFVAGHLVALHRVAGVAEEAADEGGEGHPAPEGRAVLPVAGEEPVAVLHAGHRPVDGGLLPYRADVETDAPLPLQRDHAVVQLAVQHHEAVEPLHLGVREEHLGGVSTPVLPQGLLHGELALEARHRLGRIRRVPVVPAAEHDLSLASHHRHLQALPSPASRSRPSGTARRRDSSTAPAARWPRSGSRAAAPSPRRPGTAPGSRTPPPEGARPRGAGTGPGSGSPPRRRAGRAWPARPLPRPRPAPPSATTWGSPPGTRAASAPARPGS